MYVTITAPSLCNWVKSEYVNAHFWLSYVSNVKLINSRKTIDKWMLHVFLRLTQATNPAGNMPNYLLRRLLFLYEQEVALPDSLRN
jgi:hypothetical protein